MPTHHPASVPAALNLLKSLDGPPLLIRHCEIVAEVAWMLSDSMVNLGVPHDSVLVMVGAALHDAGKILYPEELEGPGNRHEAAGEALLIANGVSIAIARACRTHGSIVNDSLSLEQLLVMAADHLWKGTRRDEIEARIIDMAAGMLSVPRWEAFLLLDPVFESIAAGGTERLARAHV